MKWLDYLVRYFVGALFIFSGLVKLNDPMGTEIKLGEYFEVFATDFGHFFAWFIPAAMPIGLLLIILEIVLGVAVLLNYRMKITIWALGTIIVFFTFLTFYSAYFNKVTDCGCFGDAIPLTPWQSFGKDVVLVVLIGYLFWRRENFTAGLTEKTNLVILSATTLFSVYLGIHAINHLPFIDFRPYAVGDNIPANMQAPELPVFQYTFMKDGREITSAKYLPAEEGYTYVSMKVLNEDKTVPPITDYNIWNEEQGDYTERSFIGPKLLLIVYESGAADKSRMEDIAGLIKDLPNEVETIAITASAGDNFRQFLARYNLNIPFFYGDATVLKAMIRSSPGLMLLNDGTVLGKWHYNDTPAPSEVRDLLP